MLYSTFFKDMFWVINNYKHTKYGAMVKRLRHGPFTAVTRVRFPMASPLKIISATKPRKILLLSVDPKNAFVKILLNTNGTNFGG